MLRFGWRGQSRESIGTVLCVDDDGILRVGFPGASRGWKADPAEMERVEEFKVGDWVRIRPTLTTAKHGLGLVTPGSIGIVYCIRPDSSLMLEISYLNHRWHCEPEEVEHVIPFKVKKEGFFFQQNECNVLNSRTFSFWPIIHLLNHGNFLYLLL